MRPVLSALAVALAAACVAHAAGAMALNGMEAVGSKLYLLDGLHGRVVVLTP